MLFRSVRRSDYRIRPKGIGHWFCEVDYKWNAQTQDPEQHDPAKPIGPEWTFDTTAATTHITQSIKTLVKAGDPNVFPGPGNVPPDYAGAIGVTKDAVTGCDIRTHQMTGALTLTRAFILPAYVATCYRLAGKTNTKPFFSWAPGEVLYLGASITVQPDQTKVVHQFQFGENLTDIEITPDLAVSLKNAHNYLWCGYQDRELNGVMAQVAIAAYVEKVYRDGDLNVLLQ